MIAFIYLALLALISSLMYYFYRKQLHMQQLLFQAKLLFFIVVANVLALMILLISFSSDGYKNFIFGEVCENGGNSSDGNLNN